MTRETANHFGEKVLMHLNEDIAHLIGHVGHVSPLRLLLIDDHLMVTEAAARRAIPT
jgi:hypothetical protein